MHNKIILVNLNILDYAMTNEDLRCEFLTKSHNEDGSNMPIAVQWKNLDTWNVMQVVHSIL